MLVSEFQYMRHEQHVMIRARHPYAITVDGAKVSGMNDHRKKY
jgi:hypothetical protein